ncbi:tetratricopeptide repeat protein [Candidatus Acetothermia bacterium]|nr:tetratricopeptide repeat protein [Candidatus Acetothermia bacterium]MBI3643015.1 tetratricopeptide repeat protein [Candidatus Acetothermia bacterium]
MGSFEVIRPGESSPFEHWGRRKTRTLLKILISERGKLFTQDELIEKLFPGLDPQKAAQNLQSRVSELRRILGPDLLKSRESQLIRTVRGTSYLFNNEAVCTIDIEVFSALFDEGQRLYSGSHWEQASKLFEEAITLYQDGYLPEDRYEEWSLQIRDEFRKSFIELILKFSECQIELKRYSSAIVSLRKALVEEPFCEEAYRQLMHCYVQKGERQKAQEVFHSCVKILKQEMDLSPSRETCLVYDQISCSSSRVHHQRQNKIVHPLYLKGRYFLSKRTEDDFKKAFKAFQNVIEIDSEYALAYSGLADTYSLSAWFAYASPKIQYPKARELALQALQLDPSLAEAHASLAYVQMNFDWNWPGAEESFQRAIMLNPIYPTAHQWYAELLVATGRVKQAIEEMQLALERDPLSLLINTTMAWMYYYARHYEAAIEQCHLALELEPTFGTAQWMIAQILMAQQKYKKAIPFFERAHAYSGNHPGIISEAGFAYARSGKDQFAKRCHEKLVQIGKQKPDPISMTGLCLGMNNVESAANWLLKAYRNRSWGLPFLKVDPLFDELRSHPHCQIILEKLNLHSLSPAPGVVYNT